MNDQRDDLVLDVRVRRQPTDSVCGPTCLHAVYEYYGMPTSLTELIEEVGSLPEGGTLAVQLGSHALSRGFSVQVYTNDLQTFDPTWFSGDVDLAAKLKAQRRVKKDPKLLLATDAYLEFLEDGGEVFMQPIDASLLRHHLDRGVPVLTGLSATYLYQSARELSDGTYDDVAGRPTGHFVLVRGYEGDVDHVLLADPYPPPDENGSRYYSVELQRLIAAIALGVVTYDANLLVIEPPGFGDEK